MLADAERASDPTALIVGASRGLGRAIAHELLARHWRVIGTVRGPAEAPVETSADRMEIKLLDTNEQAQIAALREQLSDRVLDILFVNSGTTAEDANGLQRIGGISDQEFIRVMMTNALSPMRVIEALEHLVPIDGLIGAMSSGQGSISDNVKGSRELYRGSKAALNQFMRSFAARESQRARAMILMAPGWIRTDLGGPGAPITIEEAVPQIVDVLIAKRARPGLEYLDRSGRSVPW
ncbi:MAG TPA: SDR family NAD(P)-dependent oxidoreductase [Allosphingosinicella sp.]